MRLRHLLKPILFTGFSLIVTLVQPGVVAGATEVSWSNGTPQISIEEPVPMAEPCRNEMITVVLIEPRNGEFTAETEGCVTTGADLDIATYGTSGQWGVAVRYHSDSYFHHISLSSTTASLAPGTNKLAYIGYERGIRNTLLSTVPNLATALEAVQRNEQGMATVYEIRPGHEVHWMPLSDGSGYHHSTYYLGLSQNGRFLVAYIDYSGHVLIDTSTGEIKKIDISYSDWTAEAFFPKSNAVSNDGRYVFLGNPAQFIDTLNCGDDFGDGFVRGVYIEKPCKFSSFHNDIRQQLGYNFDTTKASFSDDGMTLEFETTKYGPPKHVTLHPDGFVPSARLDYLALGDSYSSGEGDIEKKQNGDTFYVHGTELPGDCHISTRSYPFLLRDYWRVSRYNMQSVACSGAEVVPDMWGRIESYNGQKDQLVGKGVAERASQQQAALSEFKPGIVPQLEFVKKHKPRVITLTAGGNDVGFGEIIHYCATPAIIRYIPVDDTCGYAINNDMHDMLWDTIRTQAVYNKRLINEMKSASPESKIYLIGYPSFIAGSSANCAFNNGTLNGIEREMINAAVTELNNVQKKVASETGVQYVDIESSLNGGRLCEGSENVTGVANIGVDKILNQQFYESFHPNARGHQKMADSVFAAIGDNPYDLNIYGGGGNNPIIDTPDRITLKMAIVSDTTINTEGTTNLDISPNTLQAGSVVTIQGYSDPVYLGSFTVESDGSLAAPLKLPSVIGPGYHLLTLNGKTPSGELITLFQYVTITSQAPSDADADGITDSQDTCQFIQHWYDEVTGKDVCSSAPVLTGATTPTSSAGELPKSSIEPSQQMSLNLANPGNYDKSEPRQLFATSAVTTSSRLPSLESIPQNSHNNTDNSPPASWAILLALPTIIVISAILLGRIMYGKRSDKE